MASILALDPAWTEHEPSGVALITESAGHWRCAGLAPSYSQFIDLADRTLVDWTRTPRGERPDVGALLEAARRLLGGQPVDLVTVDMPVAIGAITGRRAADNAVSHTFGARGCSTHSPTATRPGDVGRELTQRFGRLGFRVATTTATCGETPALVEVYPHPALLALLHEDYRVEYKVSRATRYWRDEEKSLAEQRRLIVEQWRRIYDELAKTIAAIDLPLPSRQSLETGTKAELKRFEDALDALICAWVGVQYLRGRCGAYGDETAAIWIPSGA